MEIIFSVLGIYAFVVIGFFAKKKFKELDEKTLVLLSVYFLQPILAFWGLLKAPLSYDVAWALVAYSVVTLGMLGVSVVVARSLFRDPQDRTIATIASLIGNTGNLGIPLGIVLFGAESVVYTTLINLGNVVVVYTLGVYFYAKGNFSWQGCIKEIISMPVLWFSFLALGCNIAQFHPNEGFFAILEMGAHASMVVQLIIFGAFLASVKFDVIDVRLNSYITMMKFVAIPLAGWMVATLLGLTGIAFWVVILELCVPLAVANLNLASLYGCKPTKVAEIILISSLVFVVTLALGVFLTS